MAGRMNLPPGFEIEEPGAMNIPEDFEIEDQQQDFAAAEQYLETGRWPGVEPDKNLWQALQHGWKRAGIASKTGLAGLMQAEVELGLMPSPMFMGNLKMSPTEKKALTEWSTSTIEKADRYYEEHPEEAMQLDEDAGFLATTWDVVSHPEKMLQGVVESAPLMLEAAIGTMVAGPVGGIAVMAQPIIGNTYQTARKKGTDPFPAFMQATLTGYGEASIEQWTFGKKLGIAKGIGKIVAKGGKRIFWEIVKLWGRGTTEEGLQKFNENLWNWVFTDRSQILTEGVMQAAAVGGPLETVMGGAFAGVGYAAGKVAPGKLVPNSEKIRRVEALRNRANESSLSDDEKVELNKVFDQTIVDINDGKFDSGIADKKGVKTVIPGTQIEYDAVKAPVTGVGGENIIQFFKNGEQVHQIRTKHSTQQQELAQGYQAELGASPASQIDAAETITKGQEVLLEESNRRQAARYEELLELVGQGDELAAQEIQEMTMGGPLTEEQQKEYDDLLKKVQEGDEEAAQQIQELTTDEQNAERNLPLYEVLFEAMMEGDEAAATALANGEYKGARAAITKLETEGRVDPTLPATDEQARNFATIKVHSLARLLGMKKKDRQQIQFDLIGQKSLKGMNLVEVKKVEDYFVAQAKERGLSTSTGKELAEVIKLHSTQKTVQELSGVKPAAWKRMLQTPDRILGTFMAQSKRIERLLEALDGFTEGPIYNSIWKAVLTQSVNSRVSKNERIAKFKEVLVDIMTPELQTDEGVATAAEMIQAEDTAAGRKARKLGKRAVRKLVGDSLWARYITSGKETVIEATEVDPELSLNPSERIGVYLAMKNEDSRRHLIEGNFATFENPDLIALRVVETMSSQEREIGDWILRDLEANFERANSAAKLSLGRDLEQQDNYFPIRVLDIDILRQKDFLSTLEDKYTKQITKVEPSEVKERKKEAAQPLNVDVFNVYLNHLARIEQFIHMAPVAKSVGKILNTREFRQALNNTTAGHGTGLLDRWLKNSIQGHSIDMSPGLLTKTALWSRKKGVLFFLTGNVPSAVRQTVSIFDGVAVHPMTLVYTMQHMAKSIDPRYYNVLEKRMRELSPEMETRSFQRYLANIKHQAQAAGILTGREEWSEKALSWQRFFDRRTVTLIWNGNYDAAIHSEAVQKQFELNGSDEAAIGFSNKMTGRTQPMGNVEHLPDFFRGGPIERLLSTFQQQINNRWNFWVHDIYGMRKAGKISRKMVMYRILASHILPAMMFGAISRGGLPDDWKDVLFDQTIYLLGPLSLPGRIITDAMLGFAGGKTAVEDALTANIGKTVQAIIKGEPKQAAIPALKTVGGLTGRIPNQAIRTGQGVYDLWTGETDDLRRLIYSDWSLTQYGWPEGADEGGRESIER